MAKIMIIDDEPDVLVLVERILSSVGHEIIGAENGKAALKLLKEVRPDLILLDLMMPELTGWETLNLIRKQDRLQKVPVAMLTAKSLTPETARREDISELVDYIQKPFTRESLINRVNYCIIEDLEDIAEKRSRLSFSAEGKETASNFETVARLERLHISILATLEENLARNDLFEKEETFEAIEYQKREIEALKQKREQIEKQLCEKKGSFEHQAEEIGLSEQKSL